MQLKPNFIKFKESASYSWNDISLRIRGIQILEFVSYIRYLAWFTLELNSTERSEPNFFSSSVALGSLARMIGAFTYIKEHNYKSQVKDKQKAKTLYTLEYLGITY